MKKTYSERRTMAELYWAIIYKDVETAHNQTQKVNN